MEIAAQDVYQVLKENGVTHLYHANSVATACQFLRLGFIMSRGNVERQNLAQTSQRSDFIDRRYGIWYDVFLDSVDIHHRARQANHYGPVLFKIKLEILNTPQHGKIWVTKLNPTKWNKQMVHKKKWFTDESDLSDNFSFGSFDQMIVARHCGGQLAYEEFLESIVLDQPKKKIISRSVDVYSMAFGALRYAMQCGNIDVPIETRKCRPNCRCEEIYKEDQKLMLKMFNPQV